MGLAEDLKTINRSVEFDSAPLIPQVRVGLADSLIDAFL